MEGDATPFARQEYVEKAWRIHPALTMNTPVYSYEPNTWGPNEVASVTPPGNWRDSVVNGEPLTGHRAA
jgi:glucose-6-phosphate 1-dehydrogenase